MCSHILYGWVRFSLFFKHASLFYKKINKYHYLLVPKKYFFVIINSCMAITMSLCMEDHVLYDANINNCKSKFIYKCCKEE